MFARASSAASPLSERERDVLGLLGQAMPSKKIALALGLSIDTVKWHLKNIYGKLGVAGRDEAVAWMRAAVFSDSHPRAGGERPQ